MRMEGAILILSLTLAAAASPALGEEQSQGDLSEAGEVNKITEGKAGILWVRISSGTFTMGSGKIGEGPAHKVTIGSSFELAKTLVTNKQYKACVDAGVCASPKDCGGASKGDDQPVVCVDWNQAKIFSKWAGGRLPSEEEWEYAARSAGKDQRYPWGNQHATCDRAVMSDCNLKETAPVCSKPQGNTKQGLCDMAGNAWEWVQDWYHNTYNGAPTNGSAWETPAGSYRVLRGGSWCDVAGIVRPTYRRDFDPGSRDHAVGFRPAR